MTDGSLRQGGDDLVVAMVFARHRLGITMEKRKKERKKDILTSFKRPKWPL